MPVSLSAPPLNKTQKHHSPDGYRTATTILAIRHAFLFFAAVPRQLRAVAGHSPPLKPLPEADRQVHCSFEVVPEEKGSSKTIDRIPAFMCHSLFTTQLTDLSSGFFAESGAICMTRRFLDMAYRHKSIIYYILCPFRSDLRVGWRDRQECF